MVKERRGVGYDTLSKRRDTHTPEAQIFNSATMFRLGARCRSGSDTSIGASEANLGDGGRKQGATSKHGNGTKPPPSIWNSSNSGKSGRKRRSSLSSLDEKASALRDSIVKYAGSRTSEPRGKSDNVDAAASSGPGCDFWRNRSSGSLRG